MTVNQNSQVRQLISTFCRPTLRISAAYMSHCVAGCSSICLTRSYIVRQMETAKDILKLLPSGSPTILLFQY